MSTMRLFELLKKTLLISMALLVCLPLAKAQTFGGGTGSSGDPYIISTKAHLEELRTQVDAGNEYSGKYFKQTEDIDFNNATFNPIGGIEGTYQFKGSYNGYAHSIKNMKIIGAGVTHLYCAMFGRINNAYLQNIFLENCTINSGDYSVDSYSYTAGLVGYAEHSTITNCVIKNSNISSDITRGQGSSGPYDYLAGICGGANECTISYCQNDNTTLTSRTRLGGIAGSINGATTVTQCKNSGEVRGYADADGQDQRHAGGIVSDQFSGTISYCLNKGNVCAPDDIGGMVAMMTATTTNKILNCINTGKLCPSEHISTPSVGGMVGYVRNGASADLLIENCINTGEIIGYLGGNCGQAWNIGGIVGGNSGGNLTTVRYCYNTGKITAPNCSSLYYGGLAGSQGIQCYNCLNVGDLEGDYNLYPTGYSESSCLYDSQACADEHLANHNGATSTSDLISGSATVQTTLGGDAKWIFESGMYPRLAWTEEVAWAKDIAVAASTPVVLPEGSTVDAVKPGIKLACGNDVTWRVKEGEACFFDNPLSSEECVGGYITPNLSGGDDCNQVTIEAVSANGVPVKSVTLTLATSDVTALAVTTTGHTGTYDGVSHEASASVTTTDVTGTTTIEYRTSSDNSTWGAWSTTVPSITNVSESPIYYQVRARNVNYLDGTASDTLTLTKRPVNFAAKSESKEYSCTEQTISTVEVTNTAANEGLVSDHTHNVTFSAKGTDVGTYDDGTITNASAVHIYSGSDVTANYDITVSPISSEHGRLTITKKAAPTLTVPTGAAITKAYDGSPLQPSVTVSGVCFEDQKTVQYRSQPDGGSWSDWSDAVPGITNVGTLSVEVRTTNGNYEQATGNYMLTVTPKAITVTITGNTASPEYNGTPQSVSGYEISIPSGESLTADQIMKPTQDEVTATGTNVKTEGDGKYMMGLTANQFSENNANYNVTFVVHDGWLQIMQKPVSVTSIDAEKSYGDVDPPFNAIVSGTYSSDPIEYSLSRVAGEDATNDYHYTITPSGNQSQGNYVVSFYANGKLKINKRNISLVAENNSKTYGESDPDPLTTVTPTLSPVGTDVIAYTLSRAEGENAGTYAIMVTPGSNPNYNVSVTDATFTINQRPVTFTGKSESKTYTGSTITINTVEVTPDPATEDAGLVSGHTHNVAFSASGTEVGGPYEGTITAQSAVEITSGGSNVTANYDITVVNGALTITPTTSTFTISLDDDEYTYDGTEHHNTKTPISTAASGTTTFSYKFNDESDYVSSLSSLKKVAAGTYTIDVKGENPNYSAAATTTAKLIINKRTVTFAGKSESKTYTGSTITINTVEVTPNATGVGLVSGHTHNVTFSASGTEVGGPYEGTITAQSAVEIKLGDNNVTANYDITVTNGALTITPTTSTFTITLADDTYTYDAGAQYNHNTPSSTAATGTTSYTYSFEETGTYVADLSSLTKVDAGTYTIYVKGTNPNYLNPAETTAKLIINPIDVTVAVADADDVEYDGSAHTSDKSVVFTGILDVHTASITYTAATGTLVNEYTGNFGNDFSVKDDSENNVTANYNLTTKTPGKLKIVQNTKAIVITSSTKSWEYDAELHTDEVYTVTYGGTEVAADATGIIFTLPTNDKVTITATAAGVTDYNPGYNENNTYTYVLDNDGNYENVTANTGTLSINKRKVSVVVDNREVQYNGSEQSGNTACTFGNVVEGKGHVATITYTAAHGTTVDTYDNGAFTSGSFTVMKNNSINVTDNYELGTQTPGTLTITQNTNAIVITSSTKSWEYDAELHTDEVYTVTYGGMEVAADATGKNFTLPTNDKVTITATADGVTNYGSYSENNTYTYALENPSNYQTVTATTGTLSITKRPVTFAGTSEEKEYTGSEITINTVAVTGDGLANATHTHNVVFTAIGTEAGTYTGTITAQGEVVIKAGETNVTDNYTITVTAISAEHGTLTITPTDDPFEISLANDTITYDGTEHHNTKTPTSTAATGTTSYSYKFSDQTEYVADLASLTKVDAGTYTINVKATNPNYQNAATTTAKLIINPIEVTVAVADADDVEYDGSAHTSDKPVVFTGILSAHTASITYTAATGTLVNEYTGTYGTDFAVTDGTNDVTANYNLTTKTPGKLKIVQNTKAIVITSSTKDWEYDALLHKDEVYTVTYGGTNVEPNAMGNEFTLTTGDKVTITATAAGVTDYNSAYSQNNTYTYVLDHADQYASVTANKGTLSINKRTVTVSVEDKSVEYNGSEQSGNTEYSFDRLVSGHTGTITYTPSKGTTVNTYNNGEFGTDFSVTGISDVTNNYNLTTKTVGTLTITQNTNAISVTSEDGSWTYDGNAHTQHTYTVSFGTSESYNVTIEAPAATGTATLSTGDAVTITPAATATITHVAQGTVTNDFDYTVAHADQYTSTTGKTAGNLTVTPATLTVTTQSASKNYDGTPLTATADATASGFVTPTGGSMETATLTPTGTRTKVGTSTNTYTLDWNGTALEGDYTVTANLGTLTVNPVALRTTDLPSAICSGTELSVDFDETIAEDGTLSFTWTRTNTTDVTSAPESGTADANGTIAVTLTNATNAMKTTEFTVTPTYTPDGGTPVSGTPVKFTIKVNPAVTMTTPDNQVVCHGTEMTAVTFGTTITDGTMSYAWTRDNTDVIGGLDASGHTNISALTLTNTTNVAKTTTLSVTPTYTNEVTCTTTTPTTFTIKVNPAVTMTTPDNQVVCHGTEMTAVTFGTTITDGTMSYAWTNDNAHIGGLAASGNTNIAAQTLTNTTTETQTATITVTPTYTNNGKSCTGEPVTFTIKVSPQVTMTTPANQTNLCDGATLDVVFTTNIPDAAMTYTWTSSNEDVVMTAVSPSVIGTGDIHAIVTNTTAATKATTITVTPRYGTCTVTPATVQFQVSVRPTVTTDGNITFTCPDTTVTLKYGVCDTLIELNHSLTNHMTDMDVTVSNNAPYGNRFTAGVHTVTLKVKDECDAEKEFTQTVTVNYPPCTEPITDADGHSYPVVQVGCNCWMAANMRATHYFDGSTQGAEITPTPMTYGTPIETFGLLYTYQAATGVAPTRSRAAAKNICPEGWRLPNDDDFVDLMAHYDDMGELMSTTEWVTTSTPSNSSGFNLEPAGMYNSDLNRYEYLYVESYLWSYTPGSTVYHACQFGSACGTIEVIPGSASNGYSVRCVRATE